MSTPQVTPISRTLSVGEIARRSGVAVSALHFYEAKGLIKCARNASNQRRYPREVLRRVAIIKVAQRPGLFLARIQQAFQTLPEDRAATNEDWTNLSASWRAELDTRIAKLTQLRDQLDGCIGCGCLSLHDCPLRYPGNRLADSPAIPRPVQLTVLSPPGNPSGSQPAK